MASSSSTVVTLRINADGSAAISNVRQLADEGDRAGKRMAASFGGASAGVQAISAQLRLARDYLVGFAGLQLGKEMLSGIVEASNAIAGFERGLTAATGSQRAAAQEMAFVRSEADRLGLGLASSAQAYTALAAAARGTSLEGEGSRRIFLGVAEAARTLNLSTDATAGALNAIQQMMSKGNVQAEELRGQLGERLPGAFSLAAQAMGVTTQQLNKMLDNGQVLATDLLPKLADKLHEVYGAGAVDAANSPAANLERLKNAAFELKAAIGDAGFMSALAGGATALATALTAVVQSGALDFIVRGLAAIAVGAAAAWAIGALRTWLTSMALARVAIEGAAVAQTGLNLAMSLNPIGLVVTAVAALYEGYQYLAQREAKAREELEALNREADAATATTAALVEQLHQVDGSGFGQLGAAMRQSETDSKALKGIQDQIAAKQKEYADATVVYMERGIRTYDETTPRARELRRELDELEARANALTRTSSELSSELLRAAAAFLQTDRGAQAVANTVDRLRNASSVGSVISAVGSLYKNVMDGAIAADKKAGDSLAALTEQGAKFRKELETRGKTEAQLARAVADRAIADAVAAGKSEEQIASLRAVGDATVKLGAQIDALKPKRKVAADAGTKFVEQLEKEIATYGLSEAATQRYEASQVKLSPAKRAEAEALIATREEWDQYSKVVDAAGDAIKDIASGNDRLDEQLAQGRDKLAGLSSGQIKYNAALRDANKLAKDALALGPPTAAAQKAMEDHLKKLAELRDQDNTETQAAGLEEILSQYGDVDPFAKMTESLGLLQDKLKELKEQVPDAFNADQVARVERAIDGVNDAMEQRNIGLMQQGISALQKYTKEGTAAYTTLGIAQDVLAYKAAVAAIATQGEGDPYSAFARIAAMIALMASIGIRVAGGGGASAPSAQSAEVRQAQQGTGTVLGDAAAKSESIAHAVEITANATEQLVGINRGMLSALQALQNALGAAGGLLARGASDVEFPTFSDENRGPGFTPIASAIDGFLLGGSKEIIDQGILIAGGRLTDMLNRIVVGAYQTVETDGGLFGSDEVNESVVDISGTFGRQFQLVIESIVDTVRQGALALGLLPADIEAAIAQFHVEEIRISLKGLSAEDQQKELEAVFSSIFDGLAGSVVPFIEQFQAVGEGLGETLVRIATEVQVVHEAFSQLGIAFDETDPERVAQISDALVQAAGGIDDFISGMQSFVANFAPDSHQFSVAADALTSALGQVGLTLPSTRDGMWDLMQSLDATTESGREQIATLLRLADVSDQYYNLLEKQVADASEYLQGLGLLGGGMSTFRSELVSIRESEHKAIDAANLLAVAQGRQGASAVQIAQIHDWTARQIAAAMRRLQAETQDLIAQLYGGIPGTLDAINARISELEQNSGNAGDAIGDIADASDDLFQRWADGIESLNKYLNDSLFGDLSPLNPEQQVDAARAQLDDLIARAQAGDADALAQLPDAMRTFSELFRESSASGGDFNSVILAYRAQLEALTGMPNPGTPGSGDDGQTPIAVTVSASPELQALYAARDAALAQQEAEHRAQLAQQLAQNLHDMAVLTRTPILDMIALQDVALTDLARDMGVDLNNLTGESVLALGNMATTLGLSLTDLTTALGLSLTDLSGGLTELTERLGIDLSNLTVSSTESLAQLAQSLGADVTDLAQSVGVDLGDLADAQSLLNRALADTIDQLPEAQRDQLQPLFDAIATATTEADANAAIANLEAAVNEMGGDTANALAPFLPHVFPQEALDQLDYLEDLQAIAGRTLNVMKDIARGLDVPGYAVGTGYVPSTGLAMIHQGEAIIPAPFAAWMRENGMPVVYGGGGGAANDDTRIVAGLRRIEARIESLERSNAAGHSRTADSVVGTASTAASQREDIARRQRDERRSSLYG